MTKRAYPLSKVYGLLETGPVILLTTGEGPQANVMTLSWHSMLEFEPPLVGCVVSDRSHSFGLLQASGECVINIPTAELAKQVVGCGNCSGASTDKFKKFRLATRPARTVAPPVIEACYASLEARVVDTRMVESYALFVVQVQKAWVDSSRKNPRTLHHRGYGRFMVAGETIKLPSKMR